MPSTLNNTFTLGAGTYEVSHKSTLNKDEKYTDIKITKVSEVYVGIPKYTFIDRLKFLLTGKLYNVLPITVNKQTGEITCLN